jgi:hypothetical protein
MNEKCQEERRAKSRIENCNLPIHYSGIRNDRGEAIAYSIVKCTLHRVQDPLSSRHVATANPSVHDCVCD